MAVARGFKAQWDYIYVESNKKFLLLNVILH